MRPSISFIILLIGAALVEFALSLSIPLTFQYLVDYVATDSSTSRFEWVYLLAITFVGISCLFWASSSIDHFRSLNQWVLVDSIRRSILFQTLSIKYETQIKQGIDKASLFARNRDLQLVTEFTKDGLFVACKTMITATMFFALLLAVEPLLALIMVSFVITYSALSWTIRPALRRATGQRSANIGRLRAWLSEHYAGFLTSRILDSSAVDFIRKRKNEVAYLQTRQKYTLLWSTMMASGNLIYELFRLGILTYLLISFSNNSISAGRVVALWFLCYRYLDPLISLTQFLEKFSESRAAISRLNKWNEATLSSEYNRTIEREVTSEHAGESVNTISFRDVSVILEARSASKQILKNVGFSLRRGQITAFVGPSGAGKSTSVLVLAGLIPASSGQIEINQRIYSNDETSPAHKSLTEAQRLLSQYSSIILQSGNLVEGTLLDNITGFDERITATEVMAVCRRLGLEPMIQAQVNGLATMVDPRTVHFSGGEVQRLMLARAILKRSQLILIDEGTSALDPESQRRFYSLLQEVKLDAAIVLITHDINIAQNSVVNQVIHFSAGAVASIQTVPTTNQSAGRAS